MDGSRRLQCEIYPSRLDEGHLVQSAITDGRSKGLQSPPACLTSKLPEAFVNSAPLVFLCGADGRNPRLEYAYNRHGGYQVTRAFCRAAHLRGCRLYRDRGDAAGLARRTPLHWATDAKDVRRRGRRLRNRLFNWDSAPKKNTSKGIRRIELVAGRLLDKDRT